MEVLDKVSRDSRRGLGWRCDVEDSRYQSWSTGPSLHRMNRRGGNGHDVVSQNVSVELTRPVALVREWLPNHSEQRLEKSSSCHGGSLKSARGYRVSSTV